MSDEHAESHFSRIAVLADDLSGALASAGSLADRLGKPVPVAPDLSDDVPAHVVLNTGSRAAGLDQAWLDETVARLWASGTRVYDKRIDSTLRGDAAAEIRALVGALPERPWVVAVSAYPGAGRRTRAGHQWHGSVRLGRVSDAIAADGLAGMLGGRVVEGDADRGPECWEAENPGPYILDVHDRAHLQRTARSLSDAAARMRRPLVLVSSGEVLRYLPLSPRRPVVVVWGSRSPANRAQLAQLERVSDAAVVSAFDAPSAAVRPPVRVLVPGAVRLSPGPSTDRELARCGLRHLDVWFGAGYRPERLVLSGGDTAQAFLGMAGAHAVTALASRAPLVGAGRVQGGRFQGLEVITKGGKVGSRDLLVDLVELGWGGSPRPEEEPGHGR